MIPIDAEPRPFNWRWWLLEKAGMAIIVVLGACAIVVWIPIALILSLPHSMARWRRAKHAVPPETVVWPGVGEVDYWVEWGHEGAPDVRHVPRDPAQWFEPMPWTTNDLENRVFEQRELLKGEMAATQANWQRYRSEPHPARMFPHKYSSVAPRDEAG